MIKQGGQDMEPIFTDKQLNNMSREDLISLMKIVQYTGILVYGILTIIVLGIIFFIKLMIRVSS